MMNTKRRIEGSMLPITTLDELPQEVQVVLAEAERETNGDLPLAIGILRERLISDASMVAERAVLVSWLLRWDIAAQLQQRSWSPGKEEPRNRPTQESSARRAS